MWKCAGFYVLLGAIISSSAGAQDDEGRKMDVDNAPVKAPPTFEIYGSLRVHANIVSVDDAVGDKDETEFGLTDAYSRVGAKLDFGLGETDVSIKTELGLNIADFELGDPAFFDDEDVRIYSVTAKGDWGSLVVGKDWMPYYNAVGYPVDYFSSIYAGYTTYAFFRERHVTYITPVIGNLSGSISRLKRTGGGPKGWQGTLSYAADGLTLAAGFEDMDGAVVDTYGASASYTTGDWYFSAKVEDQDGRDAIYNVFAQRSLDKWTLKAGLGLGDQYSGSTYHLGADYQLTDSWKLFTEAYAEQLNYATLFDGANDAGDYLGAGGFGVEQNGKVILFGVRYDFSTR